MSLLGNDMEAIHTSSAQDNSQMAKLPPINESTFNKSKTYEQIRTQHC